MRECARDLACQFTNAYRRGRDRSCEYRYDLGRAVAGGQHLEATAQRHADVAPEEVDGAARGLGGGADRVSLVPVVDGYVACLSANCAAWRAELPVPEPDGAEHGHPRAALRERAAELRRASAGCRPGTLDLVAAAWGLTRRRAGPRRVRPPVGD